MALELYLPEQWVQLKEQLDRSRPPYIFVDSTYAELIPQRSAEVMLFLKQNYRVFHKSSAGTWHVLSEGTAMGSLWGWLSAAAATGRGTSPCPSIFFPRALLKCIEPRSCHLAISIF